MSVELEVVTPAVLGAAFLPEVVDFAASLDAIAKLLALMAFLKRKCGRSSPALTRSAPRASASAAQDLDICLTAQEVG